MVDDERSAVGAFLAGLLEFDPADLRSTAAKVAQFQECFLPLKYQWYPVPEPHPSGAVRCPHRVQRQDGSHRAGPRTR
ncbi:MAG: hypothetical protein R2715_02580 [Ilumatobacteraceae bacterium]